MPQASWRNIKEFGRSICAHLIIHCRIILFFSSFYLFCFAAVFFFADLSHFAFGKHLNWRRSRGCVAHSAHLSLDTHSHWSTGQPDVVDASMTFWPKFAFDVSCHFVSHRRM